MTSETNKPGPLQQFFDEIAPWSAAYLRIAVSLVGLKIDSEWFVYAASIAVGRHPMPPRCVRTASLVAANFDVELGGRTVQEVLTELLGAGFPVGDLVVKVRPPKPGTQFSAYFRPYHNSPTSTQERQVMLRVNAEPFEMYAHKEPLDLELMAASQPYSSFAELMLEYELPDPNERGGFIECWALAPCLVDLSKTKLDGAAALVSINLLKGLDKREVSAGVQVLASGVMDRFSIRGDAFDWHDEGELYVGQHTFSIPPGSVLKVFLSYRGRVQNFRWVVDPNALPNVRRTVHQSFDPGSSLLESALQQTQQSADRFEAAIGWLFWMLGFSPLFFGKVLTDAPDVVMISEDGTILVVEATTGTLQSKNKLENLAQRAELVRASITRVKIPAAVIPVLCTSAPRNLIAAHDERAAELGIVLVDGDYIDGLLKRTMFVPDSYAVAREFQAILTGRDELRFARLNAV